MPFDWTEYLKLAEFLHTCKDGFSREATLRSAISRAYYAAFCEARRHAVTEMSFPDNRDSKDHELLKRHYRSNKMSGVADRLDKLRQWRNECDYDDVAHNVGIKCKESLTLAYKLLDLLKKRV